MKGIFNLVFVISMATIINWSCGTDNEKSQSSKGLYYFTNLDQYFGFVEPYSLIKTNFAHSGDYVSKTDTSRQTSFTFYRSMNEISNKKVTNVDVSCWLYCEAQYPECSLVCSADSAMTKVYYFESSSVKKELKSINQWTEVKATFNFPDTIPDFAQVRIYLLNQSNKPVYLDDFAIQFIEKN